MEMKNVTKRMTDSSAHIVQFTSQPPPAAARVERLSKSYNGLFFHYNKVVKVHSFVWLSSHLMKVNKKYSTTF